MRYLPPDQRGSSLALRAVDDHPKLARLKTLLSCGRGEALGYLEAMWHFAGRFTPQGNIGKYPDLDIEAWIEWKGEPGVLMGSLLNSGWIDPHGEHRTVVHDWHEHADDATRLSLKRKKLEFLSKRPYGVPTVSGLPGAGAGSVAGAVTPPIKFPTPIRSESVDSWDFADWAEKRYEKHPKKANRILSLLALSERFANDPVERAVFEKNHDAFCETKEWKTKPQYVTPLADKQGGGWISDDEWKHPPIREDPEETQNPKLKMRDAMDFSEELEQRAALLAKRKPTQQTLRTV